ncbi:MAG: LacI family DNA-binding transcriptional regulator [Nocardioidaceae bacterium]
MTGPRGRQPTLEEVARRAGVGRGTASRVINGSDHVSDRSRAAVLDAVAELGYVPNLAARALVTRRTDTIAVVIAEDEDRVFGEPFFAGVIRGISRALSDADLQLVLLLADSSTGRGDRLPSFLTRQHVDGALFLSVHDRDSLPDQIRPLGIPVVLGGRAAGSEDMLSVDVDNALGARLAVDHLVHRGRRRIATITGPLDLMAGRERLLGYEDGLRAVGLPLDPALVVNGDFSLPSGEAAMRQLMVRSPDLDAVFCANDLMAAGALRVLHEARRRVPADVAVVGFDDSPQALSTHPQLTSVHQSPERMGREMVALLLQLLADPDGAESRILPTHLVVRSSS